MDFDVSITTDLILCFGGELYGAWEGQPARNPTIRLGRPFYLISRSFWYPNETIMIGRIVIKCNCITVRVGKSLSAVCPVVFVLK